MLGYYHLKKKNTATTTTTTKREESLSFLNRMFRRSLLYIRINKSMIWNVSKCLLVLIILGQVLLRVNGRGRIPFLFSSLRGGRTTTTLPSSLVNDPTAVALVPPGQCQFTKHYSSVPLLKRWKISPTSSVLRFGLPHGNEALKLSTCACLLAKATINDGEDNNEDAVIRPYTPISTNAQIGSFDLLVKDYGTSLSHHLCTTLQEGESISFSHIPFNVKIQAPFHPKYKKIGMIAGGTGITPMIQALHAILGDTENDIEVVLLYGSKTSSEILGKQLLDSWSNKYSDRLTVVHVLSREKEEQTNKEYHYGHIDAALLTQYMPPPEDEIGIFICGPPAMYETISGPPRGTYGGILQQMGYDETQVYKF